MIVVKVGGSLFDAPALGPALRAYLDTLAPAEVLLVPGGGPVADAVRALDRTHALGEEAAHWLALRSLGVTAALLERLAEEPLPPAPSPKKGGGEKPEPRVRYVVRGQPVTEDKVRRAKELRRESTPTERLLWELLRANRSGYHFRRQQVIEGYVADFYCHAAALVVEADGTSHNEQGEYDARRTTAFAMRGIHVIRFPNEQIAREPDTVRTHIATTCAARLAQEPLPPTPSPKKGGGVSGAAGAAPCEAASASEPALTPPPFLGEGVGGRGSCVLDPFAFALEDEARPGALPHTWAVTTDSIAARAAVVFRAERLVLLKSVDVPPGVSWEVAAANGWVDAHFPHVAATLACPVEVVNFRARLG